MNNIIGDTIIRLKNAGLSKKESVALPYSKLSYSVLEVLEKEGYVGNLDKKGKKIIKTVHADLKYIDGVHVITGVKQISKPSKRIYAGSQGLFPVKRGSGLLILSTSKGIMTGSEARKQKLGGELLFEIW